MPLDFPNPPLPIGTSWTATNGATYIWDGTKWTLQATAYGPPIISNTPPLSPSNGTLWWDSGNTGQLYVWYNDGNSSQYVVANSALGGPYLTEAPTDGQSYARKNTTWQPVLPLSGGTLTGPLTLSAAATISSPSAPVGSNGNGTDISITAGARDGTGVNGNIWLHTTTSGTTYFDSHVEVGTFTSQKFLTLGGPVGVNRALRFATSVSPGEPAPGSSIVRWQVFANGTAEGGSNAGSDLDIASYNDAGTFISSSVMRITRSTGLVTHNFGVSFGSVNAASTTDLSKHLALWGTAFGLSITSGRMNINAGGGSAWVFVNNSNGNEPLTITSGGVTTFGVAGNNRLTITPGVATTNPITIGGNGTGGTQLNGPQTTVGDSTTQNALTITPGVTSANAVTFSQSGTSGWVTFTPSILSSGWIQAGSGSGNNAVRMTSGTAGNAPTITVNGTDANQNLNISANGTGGVRLVSTVGFNNTAPIAKPTVSGSRGGNAALASLITALANYGLVVDSTTA